jgi:hypothetical protein
MTLTVEASDRCWLGKIAHAGTARVLRIEVLSGPGTVPAVADGLAFAVLPVALRLGCDLEVKASLSRSALRNLRELAEGWHNWNPAALAAGQVRCEEVVDLVRPVTDRVAVAWSGDVRSTFALAGGEPSVTQAGYRVDSGVYVKGLGGATAALDGEIDRISRTFAAAGKTLTVVETNAAEEGLVDPAVGVLPMVSAALHLAGAGRFGMCFHAVSEPVRAQGIRPRRVPSLADFFSGDLLRVAAVGGTSSAPAMVRHLAEDAFFRDYLDRCRANGFSECRCQGCFDCQLLDLGWSGAGRASGGPRGRGFPLTTANHVAEAALALSDWQGSLWRRLQLGARVTLNEMRRASHERHVWRKALRNEEEPWPR